MVAMNIRFGVRRARIAAILAFGLTSMSVPGIAATSPFTDIAGSSHSADIETLYAWGITKGCSATTFCPENPLLREEMAAFLNRSFVTPVSSLDYFTDDEGSGLEPAINSIAGVGITLGCGVGTFCPTGTVTRGQMAAFLVRTLGLPAGADRFTDDNGHTFEPDINSLAQAGITVGCTATSFCPDQSLTRAQMASFLVRSLGKIGCA
jgi:hypothetical protein